MGERAKRRESETANGRDGDAAKCHEVAKTEQPRAESFRPWAILLSHFAAVSICRLLFAHSPSRLLALSQLRRCRCGLLAGEFR